MMAQSRGLAPAWLARSSAFVCAAVAIGALASAAPPTGDENLQTAVRLVRAKKYDDAIDPLNAAIRDFTSQGQARNAARAYLYLTAVLVELDQKLAARQAVYSALRQDTTVPLEQENFSSRVERFIRDTAKTYVPEPEPVRPPPAAPPSTPPPTPTPAPTSPAAAAARATPLPIVLAQSSDSELERGVALVRAGRFAEGAVVLEASATRLRDEGADREIFARSQLFLAVALLGAGREAEARDAAYLVLAIFPGLDLEAYQAEMPEFSRQVTAFFAGLR